MHTGEALKNRNGFAERRLGQWDMNARFPLGLHWDTVRAEVINSFHSLYTAAMQSVLEGLETLSTAPPDRTEDPCKYDGRADKED
jgi:hypothetical protein